MTRSSTPVIQNDTGLAVLVHTLKDNLCAAEEHVLSAIGSYSQIYPLLARRATELTNLRRELEKCKQLLTAVTADRDRALANGITLRKQLTVLQAREQQHLKYQQQLQAQLTSALAASASSNTHSQYQYAASNGRPARLDRLTTLPTAPATDVPDASSTAPPTPLHDEMIPLPTSPRPPDTPLIQEPPSSTPAPPAASVEPAASMDTK
jgi:hypothetical protein